MRLLILGASGRTGTELVGQALREGHEVRALARDPAKLEAVASRIEIVVGDATDGTSVRQALAGVEAVLVALGPGRDRKSGLSSRAARSLVPAMDECGVKRVIVLSSFGVGDTIAMASHVQRLIYRTVLKDLYTDKAAADAIWRASGLDWTLVYAVTLTNRPATGKCAGAETLHAKGMPSISRGDVAAFMLAQATSTTWSKRTAILSS